MSFAVATSDTVGSFRACRQRDPCLRTDVATRRRALGSAATTGHTNHLLSEPSSFLPSNWRAKWIGVSLPYGRVARNSQRNPLPPLRSSAAIQNRRPARCARDVEGSAGQESRRAPFHPLPSRAKCARTLSASVAPSTWATGWQGCRSGPRSCRPASSSETSAASTASPH